MATFTTWAALRDSIKDRLATLVAGDPCIGSYEIMGKTLRYRSIDELAELFKLTYTLADLENSGEVSQRTSYGRFSDY